MQHRVDERFLGDMVGHCVRSPVLNAVKSQTQGIIADTAQSRSEKHGRIVCRYKTASNNGDQDKDTPAEVGLSAGNSTQPAPPLGRHMVG
jgi:hypothetical protein